MASPGKGPIIVPPASVQPLNWQSAYPPAAWKQIRYEGLYLASLLLAMVAVAILILKLDFQNHPLLKELLSCGLGGIVGSWIYSIRWFVKAIVGKLWGHDYIVWRLTAPWMGIFLAVSTYLIIKTGLFGVVVNQNNADSNLYAYGVGFLAGLFSDEVMKKLAAVASTLFGKTEAGEKTGDQGQTTGNSAISTTP
jgi:fluoride ion exporter CrcB/FEX